MRASQIILVGSLLLTGVCGACESEKAHEKTSEESQGIPYDEEEILGVWYYYMAADNLKLEFKMDHTFSNSVITRETGREGVAPGGTWISHETSYELVWPDGVRKTESIVSISPCEMRTMTNGFTHVYTRNPVQSAHNHSLKADGPVGPPP